MYYDRYLGKLAGLVGKDDVENAQIDAVVDFFNDYNYSKELIRSTYYLVQYLLAKYDNYFCFQNLLGQLPTLTMRTFVRPMWRRP